MPTVAPESRVRAAFAAQASYCEQLGSAFTARLCALLAARLSRSSSVGAAILDWHGDPAPEADNLPLRVTGALHWLVRAGQAPALAALYPPPLGAAGGPADPADDALADALERTLAQHSTTLQLFIRRPPQINEVGRAALLLAGLLGLAARHRKPIVLLELGASAGLNLLADRYRCRFGDVTWSPAGARLTLAPRWQGPPPPVAANLAVMRRRGCDLSPVDLADPAERERLVAYVWPDQPERLARLQAAIDTAIERPPIVERMEPLYWLEAQLGTGAPPNALTVIWHSVFWRYLEPDTQRQITSLIETAGAIASASQPLAWLRFEIEPSTGTQIAAHLTQTTWPPGEQRRLATAHPHGAWIRWEAA
jgi:hypothetical protein